MKPRASLDSVVQTPPPVFDRVLVPTDFTDVANIAIRYACAMVSPGGTINLVHIRHRFGPSAEETVDRLHALIPQDVNVRDIHFEALAWDDDIPAYGILNLAARLRVDAISIGATGCSGIVGALLGSTAQAVLAKSTIPVLLARRRI